MTIMTDCFKMTFVSAVFMAVLISLVFKKLILAIVKVNNSYKINKTVSCLTKTQPEPFLSNGILMILCVNVPIVCAYSIIRHAQHLFCFTTKHAIVRNFQKRPFLIAFFVLIDMWELHFRRVRWQLRRRCVNFQRTGSFIGSGILPEEN